MLCLREVGILLRRFMYQLNHANLCVCSQMLRLLRNAEAKKKLQGGLAPCALIIPEILNTGKYEEHVLQLLKPVLNNSSNYLLV